MIQIFDNYYQLNDNGVWGLPGFYRPDDFRRLCLGATKARILGDNDTIVICNCASGYKLKLKWHNAGEQNNIIDVLTPYLITL